MDDTQEMIEGTFQIPATEGVFDQYTANDAAVLADTAANIIGNGAPFTSIPIQYGSKKARKSFSEAEQFVEGLFAVSDQNLTQIPESTDWMSQQGWFAPNRGWLAQRVILFEEDDELIPDIRPWDVRNTLWWPGSKGTLWSIYMRRLTVDAVEQEYGETVTGDNENEVNVYDIWDDEENGVLVSSGEKAFDWVKSPKPHHIGHNPVHILPVGNRPYVIGGDGLVNVGKDILFNDRHLIEVKSRVASYVLTTCGTAAKTPNIVEWDGAQGDPPDFSQTDVTQKGGTIPIDISRGEKFYPGVQPQIPQYMIRFLEMVQRDISIGGISAVVQGMTQGAMPGVTLQQLTQGALKILNPYIQTVEKSRSWAANELVRQFNALDKAKGMHVEGVDRQGYVYSLDRKPGDLPENPRFQTRIVANILQDKQTNLAMAAAARAPGPNGRPLLSDETIRDEFHLVQDTDAEDEKIDKEKVYSFFSLAARRVIAALRKDGDDEDANLLDAEVAKQQEQPQGQQGTPPGIPVKPPITARAGQIQDQPNLMQRAMNRLKGLRR